MIEMIKVNKYFAAFHVLKDIDLLVSRGEKVVVCGPSGSGKSTLIRLVNRLEEHQSGKVVVDGIELTDDVKKTDMVRREVYRPLGIHHAPKMHTLEPDGSRGVPLLGFGLYPTVEDVQLMRQLVGSELGVKASGGVRTAEDVVKMAQAGANRIGASASVAIVTGKGDSKSKGY